MIERPVNFRDIFAEDATVETVRAFLLFGALTLALLGIAGHLSVRGLGLEVLRERLNLGHRAAAEIAREVAEVGTGPGGIDHRLLRQNQRRLQRLIHDRIARTGFIRHVEVRDRFGVRIILVPDEGSEPVRPATAGEGLAADWPALDQRIIQVPLTGASAVPAGNVLLSISPQAVEQELRELRRSLWLKIVVAAILALGVLVLGLFYVLHLIRRNRNLERARQSAERASYVGLLASGLAHEIRNPLNAMNMNVQMLEEELQTRPEVLQEEETELLDSTKTEIKRLERLVNNFLTYARPAQPRFDSDDLNAVVREVTRLLEVDFRQHQVELAEDLEPLLPRVETDETQFKQALINLLVNARQVLKTGGRVTIRTRAGVHGEVVIEVVDDGPGIEEEALERIFEVFYSSRGGGTGLGLPIAKQIVERHGGTIEVDSAIGHGTTFRIRLPRHHRREAAPSPVEETA